MNLLEHIDLLEVADVADNGYQPDQDSQECLDYDLHEGARTSRGRCSVCWELPCRNLRHRMDEYTQWQSSSIEPSPNIINYLL